MRKRTIAMSALTLLGVGIAAGAYIVSPTIMEGTPGETPELGRYGDLPVGTREVSVTLPDRVSFTKVGMATGAVERRDRIVQVRLYYPAEAGSAAPRVTYEHTMKAPDMEPVPLEYTGWALDGAAPVATGSYPLVIMSHGFNGWNTQFSNLAEHIASRGYVVASIDHGDMEITGVTDFVHSFHRVLVDRTLDQRGVLLDLLENTGDGGDPVYSLIDPQNVGLIGYSMGGYGAFASAGSAYDLDSDTFANVPEDARDALRAGTPASARVHAVVAFAPWGGQPDNRVWNEEALAKVNVPVLLVGGSEDDVSNYGEGIRWIYDNLVSTDRYLLTFREARHNIVGNHFTVPEDAPFRVAEFLNEPVWRQDRINAINQHFVAAFLDWTLKGETDKRRYLDVPASDANASEWPTGFGDQLNGTQAGDDQPDHWRGFQRRWAVGLTMEAKAAGAE